MRIGRAILWTVAALACAAPALAQETDENEPLSTAKLSVEEAGRLLATGRAAYEDGLFRLARRRLEELVAGAPDKRRQAEGALWLARVQLAMEQPADALDTLDTHGGGVRAQALAAGYALARAQARFALGQLPEAAAELDGFREKFAEQDVAPAALRLLSRIFMARNDWPGAPANASSQTWYSAADASHWPMRANSSAKPICKRAARVSSGTLAATERSSSRPASVAPDCSSSRALATWLSSRCSGSAAAATLRSIIFSATG